MVVLGEIVAAYGVKGWVKVKPFTERLDTLLDFATWWLRPRQRDWEPLAVTEAREHSGSLIVQLAGTASRESAMQWKGALVGVPRDALPPLGAGEIYQADLVGLDVVNRTGTRLGRVIAVQDFGAHPVLDVEREGGGAHRLIPFVPVYVDGVDLAARRIDVDWESDY
jgi:16S rRNA processing protein RimM